MTLENKIIVILGNTFYKGPIRSTSLFIAKHLAIQNTVYYVDYPLTIKDYVKSIKSNNAITFKRKFSLSSNGLLETDIKNLKIITIPPVLAINFLPEGALYRFLLKINERIIGFRLKKILHSKKNAEIIYINSFNFHYPNIAKIIRPNLTVYYCVDPMIIPYDIKHGLKSEKELVINSDVVLCTSKALYKEKSKLNGNTYFIPNASELGGDTIHSQIHPKLIQFKKPIIGYLGTIERRIDYELVERIAFENPKMSFVMAGPTDMRFIPKKIFENKNIHFVGAIEYSEVSQIINSFDIAIIPFKNDSVSETIFPIKLFEYMSLGKPIVMTDFNNDLRDYTKGLVKVCNDSQSFSKAIREYIIQDDKYVIAERKRMAMNNSWKARAEQISEILSQHLSK